MTVAPHTEACPVSDTQVRIGDLRIAQGRGEALITVGLGSCVGVVLADRISGAVGLAHVFLPTPPVGGGKAGAGAGTYADLAIPELVRQLVDAQSGPRRNARSGRFVAIIAGGARMFAARPGAIDVGERNIAAVREALAEVKIDVVATDTGGSHGRTMRVTAGLGNIRVMVRQVGRDERELWTDMSSGEAAKAA